MGSGVHIGKNLLTKLGIPTKGVESVHITMPNVGAARLHIVRCLREEDADEFINDVATFDLVPHNESNESGGSHD